MKKVLSITLSVVIAVISMICPINAFAAESKADKILSEMSLQQKIEQMLMIEIDYGTTGEYTGLNDDVKDMLKNHNLGSVIYFSKHIKTTEGTFNLTMDLQSAATENGGIPMLIAADQEGGMVYRLGSGTAMPGNMALAATGNPDNGCDAGIVIGSELSVLGINTNLAPVVDVNSNPNNSVIGLRSFGDDPAAVSAFADEMLKGLKSKGVVGCLKHFPGHGDTETDSHYGLPSVDKSLDELMKNELLPYQNISKNADMVMTAHILFPQVEKDKILSEKTGNEEMLPATLSDDIVTGLLKNKFGFKGIVVTDAMNMAGVANNWDILQASKLAINAGIDMLCMPVTVVKASDIQVLDSFISSLCKAVENGEIKTERINDAVKRILTIKENNGILDFDVNDYSLEKAISVVGSKQNRETERRISAEGVTVLKNDNKVLPLVLNDNSKLLILNPYSNEPGQMAMGWNRAKACGIIPDGAQVKIAVYSSADAADVTPDINAQIEWADTVVVVSEISSANTIKNGSWLYNAPANLLKTAHSDGKKTVHLSADKPYDVSLFMDYADAVMAVYGDKGSAVDPTEALIGGITESKAACGPNLTAGVEVLLGVYGADGKLPVNIPSYSAETGKFSTSDIVFERGTGISYCSLKDGHTDSNGDGVCDKCSEIYDSELYEKTQLAKAEISVVKGKKVGYKTIVVLEANVKNLPDGYKIVWYDGSMQVGEDGRDTISFVTEMLTRNKTYTCKIIDESGNVVSTEDQEKTVEIEVRTNIFARIIWWFKSKLNKQPVETLTY